MRGDAEVYAGAALLGALSGLRSMAAPVAIAQLSHSRGFRNLKGPLALVAKPPFAITSRLLVGAELVADKLPFAPNRTAVGPLLGRAVTGGIAGAVLFSTRKRSALVGSLLGAAAAIGAAYGAFALRKQAVRNLRIPDAVVALAEDAIVGAAGLALVSRLRRNA